MIGRRDSTTSTSHWTHSISTYRNKHECHHLTTQTLAIKKIQVIGQAGTADQLSLAVSIHWQRMTASAQRGWTTYLGPYWSHGEGVLMHISSMPLDLVRSR